MHCNQRYTDVCDTSVNRFVTVTSLSFLRNRPKTSHPSVLTQ